MDGDQIEFGQFPFHQPGTLAGHKFMGSAVETIAPNPIPLIQFIGQRIDMGPLGYGLVKGGIEHRHLRYRREQFSGNRDPVQIGGVVQWRQRTVCPYGFNHLVGDDRRLLKIFPAMNDAMADNGNLISGTHHPFMLIAEDLAHLVHAALVIGDPGLFFDVVLSVRVRVHLTANGAQFFADAFHQPRGQNPLISDVEQLELYRRASRIDNQHFHL